MRVRVKICGITSASDAQLAVKAGADALGFIFVRDSPRFVEALHAKAIIRSLPPFVSKVGVFQNASREEVQGIAEQVGLDTLQFHGDEPPDFCRTFALTAVKAFRMRDETSIQEILNYRGMAWLLDSYVSGQGGGTGRVFDWGLATRVRQYGEPMILAGGLKPETVGDAIKAVKPYAVDVSSGVELSPGIKDPAKVHNFLAAITAASAELR